MAWHFDIEGYLAPDGSRVYESPDDVTQTDGILAHGYDPDNPDDDVWFWVYHPDYFDSLDEAYDHIQGMAGDYGIPYG